ncbi:hypothetical protein N0V94_000314 [Neodidymelliopsis sp. IMI 364377]|nr:hypothetical protein N0V94_000314 [Neodidymelliopsis sp. IMI 364377]
MLQDKAVKMKDLSRDVQMNEEEHVGLLREDHDGSEEIIDSSDEEDLFTEKSAQRYRPHRPWIKKCAGALLSICTLILIVHWYRSPRKYGTPIQATLRAEDDYILHPAWDFAAAPTTREYTWTIADHELNPDGVYRPMLLINSTFPGPLIEVNEHDEVVVHVHNRATNATSIHWHGLYQNATSHMDGTVGVTNCPIAPGQSFTYRFNVTGQTGTYWYHSHVSMQASDGLVGPLVIHGRQEKELQKMPYKQDRVVLLSDYYYDLSSDLLMEYLAPGSENDEPVPPSALINGRNVRDCASLPNRNCSSSNLSKALLDLSAGENTRLRIINVGAFAEFSLQIDEHEFSVTEVDGTDVHPQSIHRLNINPAQRYSIVLSPPANPKQEGYWMRAKMVTHCFAYENPELSSEVWAIIRYTLPSASPSQSLSVPQTADWPETIEVECRDLNTTLLSPVLALAAPQTAHHLISLRSSFQIGAWRLSRGYLNTSSFRPDARKPILHSLLSLADTNATALAVHEDGIESRLFDPKTSLVHVSTGVKVVDILVQNLDDGNHPFHLHGYKFWVLAQGKGYAPVPSSPSSTSSASTGGYEGLELDLQNLLRRDTASVAAYGWLLIRFVADNPGAGTPKQA